MLADQPTSDPFDTLILPLKTAELQSVQPVGPHDVELTEDSSFCVLLSPQHLEWGLMCRRHLVNLCQRINVPLPFISFNEELLI